MPQQRGWEMRKGGGDGQGVGERPTVNVRNPGCPMPVVLRTLMNCLTENDNDMSMERH